MSDIPAAPTPVAPVSSELPKCGLVMPISAIGDCNESHWRDVKTVLTEAIEAAGFKPNLVSSADESRIIQNTIVENLYQNEMVVCDVSWKNPNVMFELGLRLAFDLPTVVVKDRETEYIFDTQPLGFLPYPRSLRYGQIVDFKKDLTTRVKATYEAAKKPDYKSFLKTFSITKVATIKTQEVSRDEYMIALLQQIVMRVSELDARQREPVLPHHPYVTRQSRAMVNALLGGVSPELAVLLHASAGTVVNNARPGTSRDELVAETLRLTDTNTGGYMPHDDALCREAAKAVVMALREKRKSAKQP